ncbi:amphiregulin isoform X2 [Xenopus laevis]|uniref:Amphiregulin isoform X2 n=1 Tax=Xenopus laevis TaxID=8355 RepID=A0A8J0U7P2_XENLA|nr:amphiregulin isoform X2 [Xenopus laevis]
MFSLRSVVLCATLLLTFAHCSELNSTQADSNVTFSGDHGFDGTGSAVEVNWEEEEDEEHEDDFSILGFITDDSIRVEPVVKPENPPKNGEKKNSEKKKKKERGDKKKKKKKNPCQNTHKDYCIHGECKYLASLQEVTCKCQPEYFGERCSEQSMKTQTKDNLSNMSTIALAVVAVLLSTISITAIIIIIVVHTRRKYASYQCEVEEKKRLGQENGSEEIDV